MAEFSFPKKSRLLDAAQFKAVFDGANIKVSSRYFLILARSTGTGSDRLGLVIAKKNIARAVGRNRIKRQIREFFRQQAAGPGLDLVVLARKDADTLSNPEIRDALGKLWKDVVRKGAA